MFPEPKRNWSTSRQLLRGREVQLRGQLRSQVQLGNEEKDEDTTKGSFPVFRYLAVRVIGCWFGGDSDGAPRYPGIQT